MTGLTRIYSAFLLLLSVGLVVVLVAGLTSPANRTGVQVVAMTRLPGPALAVSYFEPRWRLLDDGAGPLFPGMRSLGAMDFSYAP